MKTNKLEYMKDIQWKDENIAKLWNYYANNPEYQKQYFSYHSGKYILKYIEKYVKFNKMKYVLDYGCGPGYLIENLLKFGVNGCYGLDFSKNSVNEVNRKLKDKNGFNGAICINKLPSPIDDEIMDLVIAVEVVEHLQDDYLSDMLNEIYRVLKPGGYVVITTPNKESLDANKTICPDCGCIFHRWQHVRVWTQNTLSLKMEEFGFKTVHVAETNFTSKLKKTAMILWSLFGNMNKVQNFPPHLIYIGRR